MILLSLMNLFYLKIIIGLLDIISIIIINISKIISKIISIRFISLWRNSMKLLSLMNLFYLTIFSSIIRLFNKLSISMICVIFSTTIFVLSILYMGIEYDFIIRSIIASIIITIINIVYFKE